MTGIPRTLVLGPPLWNLRYNNVLHFSVLNESTLIGFADNLVVSFGTKQLKDIEEYANKTIKTCLEMADLALGEPKRWWPHFHFEADYQVSRNYERREAQYEDTFGL